MSLPLWHGPRRLHALFTALLFCLLLLPAAASADPGHGSRMVKYTMPNGQTARAELHGHTAAEMQAAAQRVFTKRMLFPVMDRQVAWTNPMPANWCGEVRPTDDIEHALHPGNGKVIKLVYAHAADQPNRLLQPGMADQIQTDVRNVMNMVAVESGYTKSIRFDMGTLCGPEFVDITSVQLDQGLWYYTQDRTSRFDRLYEEISERRGEYGIPADANIMVLGDSMGIDDGIMGEGLWMNDDNPDPATNWANKGGLFGGLYGINGWSSEFPSFFGGYSSLLHEITHMLGAVNNSAPHASGAGHCWDTLDVMCYDDGGTSIPAVGMQQLCNELGFGLSPYDCAKDDYFNPAPAPGSYLATHWNLYNSSFLCGVNECVTVDSTPPARPSRPTVKRNKYHKPLVLRWTNNPANSGVAVYEVRVNGKKLKPYPRYSKRRTYTQATFKKRVRPGRKIKVTIVATDAAGNRSQPSPARTVKVAKKKHTKKHKRR